MAPITGQTEARRAQLAGSTGEGPAHSRGRARFVRNDWLDSALVGFDCHSEPPGFSRVPLTSLWTEVWLYRSVFHSGLVDGRFSGADSGRRGRSLSPSNGRGSG